MEETLDERIDKFRRSVNGLADARESVIKSVRSVGDMQCSELLASVHSLLIRHRNHLDDLKYELAKKAEKQNKVEVAQ